MELATYKKDGYFLEDGELLSKEYPDTFRVPSSDARSSIKLGSIVKLIFNMLDPDSEEGVSVERMWVEVKELEKGLYVGTLDNDPYGNVLLKCGDDVVFGPEHIIDIYEE
ncbi:DUF2314 domain-containing protein [Vibrio vulnificus]|nr:DUF2314 domain-containing protein [Vibrio vulnificus]MCU8400216.1 DUF2314 domain-containing protein [Vibrio vulnificus]